MAKKPIKITEVVLRDAHQSLLATRMTMDEMRPDPARDGQDRLTTPWSAGAALPSTPASVSWTRTPGSACASCARSCPNTKLQMLFRGQNMLGYRHYADDARGVLCAEVCCQRHRHHPYLRRAERPPQPGDRHQGGHQGKAPMCRAASATPSAPCTTTSTYANYAKTLEEMGAHCICIKDMAGLLDPLPPPMSWSKSSKETISASLWTSTATTPPAWLPCPC